jgi:hypothetical protein
MRASCGLPLAIRVALHTILVGLFLGVAPQRSYAQATSTLPKPWNDAVAKLADEVAAAMSPTAVRLDVESISSLDASNVALISNALQEQLQRHNFAPVRAGSRAGQSAVPLVLWLSESAREYVWVIAVLDDSGDAKSAPMMIVSVSKADLTEGAPEKQSLSVEKRYVWKQPGGFLDFAILKDATSGESTLLILETNRLVVYKPSGAGWQFFRSSSIPRAVAPSRDPYGTIDRNEGTISFKGFACVGDPDLSGVLQCKAAKPNNNLTTRVKIPGLPTSLGTLTSGECRGETISLYTGEGDWTQTDSIQGYLINLNPISAAAVGDAVQTDGPVISLQPEHDTSAVRAIVRNLKTGEYEAYVVTATCGN